MGEKGNRHAVKVVANGSTCETEERRREISVCGDNIRLNAFSDTWPAHHKWDVDVLFKGTLFSGLQAVLADVVAIVCCVEDVGVLQQAEVRETDDDFFDEFVDSLQCAKAVSVEVIVGVDVGLVLLGEPRDP